MGKFGLKEGMWIDLESGVEQTVQMKRPSFSGNSDWIFDVENADTDYSKFHALHFTSGQEVRFYAGYQPTFAGKSDLVLVTAPGRWKTFLTLAWDGPRRSFGMLAGESEKRNLIRTSPAGRHLITRQGDQVVILRFDP